MNRSTSNVSEADLKKRGAVPKTKTKNTDTSRKNLGSSPKLPDKLKAKISFKALGFEQGLNDLTDSLTQPNLTPICQQSSETVGKLSAEKSENKPVADDPSIFVPSKERQHINLLWHQIGSSKYSTSEDILVLVRQVATYLPKEISPLLITNYSRYAEFINDIWETKKHELVSAIKQGVLPFYYYLLGTVSAYAYCNARDYREIAAILSTSTDQIKACSNRMTNQIKETSKSLEHQTVQYNQVARIVGDIIHKLEVANFEPSIKPKKLQATTSSNTLSATSILTEDYSSYEEKLRYDEKGVYKCKYGLLNNGHSVKWQSNGKEGTFIELWVLSGIATPALFKLLNNDLDQIVKYTSDHPDIIPRMRSTMDPEERKAIIKEIYYATVPASFQWNRECKYQSTD